MYQERSSAYKNYNENSEDYDLKPSAYTRTNSNNNAGASSSRRRRAVEPKSPSPAQDPIIETMGSDGSGEDMEVSEDEVQVDDAVSSDNGRGRNQRGMSYGEDTEIDEAQEDEIDIEEEEAAVEDDDEDQEDQLSSSPSNTPPSKPTRTKGSPNKPQLKIKLKFNKAASTATPTPSDEMPIRAGRKGHPRHIESEDSEDSDSSSRSNPYVPTRLTQRQAALAGIAEQAEHLVLEETVSKKKKYLNETEAALRREETARKRKNLSVKKLEDEKTETINRLLKKQSRPRGKKGAPAPVDVEEDGEADAEETPASLPPRPFRLYFDGFLLTGIIPCH
ncbi:hypothetical protein PNOK_0556300 [Pyrrhoderma noxium]|uniref:INO80 complex subunit B-like conserved region domain-containing protein n=1 Tax=Pyrrhoderma noxium TaxID=2282107 RepID=A0A286UGI9_9AGAM|nr:hypothetical protein PNOK_0556300 [Pyrrhoderma noxium]